MNDGQGAAGSSAPQPAVVPVAPPTASRARTSLLFWMTAALILVLDLTTKHYVFRALHFNPDAYSSIDEMLRSGPRPKLYVLGEQVRFVAMLNPGMMWGAFDNHPGLLRVVRPLAVLVIFILLSSIPATQWTARLALGGILGGALGNIYDSFRYLGVRDFLEVDLNIPVFHPFPAFNLADSAICVGVAVLALGMLRAPAAEERGDTGSPSDPAPRVS